MSAVKYFCRDENHFSHRDPYPCRISGDGDRMVFMKESKQIELFSDEMDRLISRFSTEFDMTLASMIGVLQVKIHELVANTLVDEEEE